MNSRVRKNIFLCIVGDIVTLYLSLFFTLIIRYLSVPDTHIILSHLIPFSVLFLFWIVIFFIFGMYERQNFIEKKKIIPTIIQSQFVNILIAIVFFYISPLTAITPKTNLIIYIFVSIILLVLWRIIMVTFVTKKQIPICIIAEGDDVEYLKKDLEHNKRGFKILNVINITKEKEDVLKDIKKIAELKPEFIVIDSKNPLFSTYFEYIYEYLFMNIGFLELSDLYENLYNRIPLQNVTHRWFVEHIKTKPHALYDVCKRIMDITISFLLFLGSLIIYPIVFFLIKTEDRGPILYRDIRVGFGGKIITVLKFRSMTVNFLPDTGKKAETKVGRFLRKTRIDEIPQLINVLRGDLSLIGPRPEQPKLVENYTQTIPFYGMRHFIKPGLSGWAQIYHDNHPHHDIDIWATKEKVSYDLFYLKNRSFILDLIISLKTIKTLLLSKGK